MLRILSIRGSGPNLNPEAHFLNASRFNPIDLTLFARALWLAKYAQRMRTTPIPALVAELARRGRGVSHHPVDRLSKAVERATGRWASWFGGSNTCLVRSLVLGALLADRGGVVLNVGFREGDGSEPRLAGHAWLTVGGEPSGSDAERADARFTRVLEVPYGGPAEQ